MKKWKYMPNAEEAKVNEALGLIIENKEVKALNYAVNYAKYGLRMTGDELKTQCLYVLNNMAYWRGAEAKFVRTTLKAFCGIK